jgi:hypothetical protein
MVRDIQSISPKFKTVPEPTQMAHGTQQKTIEKHLRKCSEYQGCSEEKRKNKSSGPEATHCLRKE